MWYRRILLIENPGHFLKAVASCLREHEVEDESTAKKDEDVEEELPSGASRQPPRQDLLRLYLEHGDVMIMQGENFQRVIEHAVVPKGFRIAATARYIS